MPTGHNSAIYKEATKSSVDASLVITLRAAGALIFGKTTTTEFAATSEGGPCTNPHNPNHTPGGSSSGSGAAVADFQVPIALGTQTGGSIIRPGSFNGVYAFKVLSLTLSDAQSLTQAANMGRPCLTEDDLSASRSYTRKTKIFPVVTAHEKPFVNSGHSQNAAPNSSPIQLCARRFCKCVPACRNDTMGSNSTTLH